MSDYMEILIVARDLASGDVESANRRIQKSMQDTRQAARDAEQDFSHLDQTEQDLARTADNLGLKIERTNQGLVLHRKAASDAEQGVSDMDAAVRNLARSVENLSGSLDRNSGSMRSHASAAKEAERSTSQLVGSIGALAIGAPLAAAGLVGIGQAAAGAIGGVVALGAALSSLSALAVALPAGLAGLGGLLGAAETIIKPALSPVLSAVQNQNKLNQPGAQSGGGGGGGISPATQQQHTAIQNAWQMQALEQQLHNQRLSNSQSEQRAEQTVATTRASAVQNLLQLERQLHALKMTNQQQEAQLQQTLADARASAAEEARLGGDHAQIAAGMVSQAQDNLDQFQASAAQQVQQAQDAVDQARVQGIQQVQAAEQALQQTRVSNAQALANIQTQIAHTQIQNQWQMQAAAAATAAAQNSTTSAMQQQLAALKAMTPLQKQVYDQITAIEAKWKTLTAPGRAVALGAASNILGAVQQGLPGIASIGNQFTGAAAGISNYGVQQATQPQFEQRLSGFFGQIAGDTKQSGKALVDLTIAFTNFMTAPATRAFIQWMTDGATALGKWARAEEKMLEDHGSLTRFFKNSEGTIKTVGGILKDAAEVLFNIGKAAAPSGRSLLTDIKDFMDHLAKETGSKSGMASLREFFQKAAPEAVSLGHSVVIIAGAIAQLLLISQNAPNVLGFVADALTVIAHLPYAGALVGIGIQLALMAKFIPGMGGLLSAIGDGLWWIAKRMALALAEIDLWDVAIAIWTGITAIAEGVAIGFGIALDFMLGPIGLLILAIALLAVGLYELYTHWDTVSAFVKKIAHDVWGALPGWMRTWLTDTYNIVKDILGTIWQVVHDTFVNAWKLIGDYMNLIGDIIHGRWGNILDDVKNIGADLIALYAGIWGDILDGADKGWQDILKLIASYVNDLIDLWDWVVTHVPGLDGLKIGHVSWGSGNSHQSRNTVQTSGGNGTRGPGRKLAAGGFAPATPGGLALIAEGGHDELVVTTDPQHLNRSLMLIMQWMERMGQLPKFDLGGWFKHEAGSVLGGAEAIAKSGWDAASALAELTLNPVGWVKDHMPHLGGIAGEWGGMIGKMFGGLGGKVEDALINKVETLASAVGIGGPGGSKYTVNPNSGESGLAARAVNFALREVGLPYVYGAENPGVSFDCSGLIQWAYRTAGLMNMPRTSETQAAAGYPNVPYGQWLPGDLLFSEFPGDPDPSPGHVTMYIGDGRVVQAPHTGAFVEVSPVGDFLGSVYRGAVRPAPGPVKKLAAGGWTGTSPSVVNAWNSAKRGLLSVPAGHGMGTVPVGMGPAGSVGGPGTRREVYAPITIHTTQAETDGDYLARTLEQRLVEAG